MPLWNPIEIARRLRKIGLIGIGQRNAHYVLMHNPRKFYPRVDDKLITKKLAIEAGLPVPELYAVVREEHEIAELHEKIKNRESFVVKPAHGSGGDGILVIHGRRGDKYRRANGSLMNREEFEHHPVELGEDILGCCIDAFRCRRKCRRQLLIRLVGAEGDCLKRVLPPSALALLFF